MIATPQQCLIMPKALLFNVIHKVNTHCVYIAMYIMYTYCLFQSMEAFPAAFLDQLSPQTQSMGCRSQQSLVPAVHTKFTIVWPVIIIPVVSHCDLTH